STFIFFVRGLAANNDYGTMVGTGNTAVSMLDNALAAKIAHGTSSGQMEHGAVSLAATADSSATESSLVITRSFTNSSGGSISVAETGVQVLTRDSAAANQFFLIIRDVLSSAVVVNNGQVITVTYTIKVTT
ncbi:hypothetical protein LCGC14_1885690, partial [marine sediment metagenome]